jgi:hypothetical protein
MLGTHPEYRAMFAVDIEKSAGRGDPASSDASAALRTALRKALGTAGIRWTDCHHHDLGDGSRLVLGRGMPKAPILAPLAGDLAAQLRTYNRTAGPRREVRVRMAVHAGDVYVTDGAVEGGSLEHLARLLEAPPLRDVLAAAPKAATVAVAVSEHVWTEVVRHDHDGIDPATYQRVDFTVKETAGRAWLHVPGHVVGPLASAADALRRTPDVPKPDGDGNQLIVTGGRVGEMIGSIGSRIDHVTGDVHIGDRRPSTDDEHLHHQLADLRRALAEAQAAGTIDQETYEEATAELRTADASLAIPGRPRFLPAMRKLKGLVEDVAALATKVATIIDAVRGR